MVETMLRRSERPLKQPLATGIFFGFFFINSEVLKPLKTFCTKGAWSFPWYPALKREAHSVNWGWIGYSYQTLSNMDLVPHFNPCDPIAAFCSWQGDLKMIQSIAKIMTRDSKIPQRRASKTRGKELCGKNIQKRKTDDILIYHQFCLFYIQTIENKQDDVLCTLVTLEDKRKRRCTR